MLSVLGIILFILSIIFLLQRKYFYSTLLYTFFATRGLSIIPEELGFIKLSHLAFFYTIVFVILNKEKLIIAYRNYKSIKYLLWVIIYFICSIAFSVLYYGFPVIDTIITGSRYIVLLSFFVFYKIDLPEYSKLMRFLFYITFYTSILYCLQCVTGVQLLAYSLEVYDVPTENGLFRFYNNPPLCGLFLYCSFFYKDIIPKRYRFLAPIVFIMVVFLSNGRTAIAVTIFSLLLIAFFTNNKKVVLWTIMFVGILFLSVQSLIMSRFDNGGKTFEDINLVTSGKFYEADYQSKNGYTMLYRFAWVYERWNYLMERPIVEPLFGLGLLTDENPIIQQKYHFRYGLINPDTGNVAQIRTPDISWGNFLTCFGILGSIYFFIFYFNLLKEANYKRKYENLFIIIYVCLITTILESFSGSSLSEPYSLVGMFLFFNFANKKYIYGQNNSNNSML